MSKDKIEHCKMKHRSTLMVLAVSTVASFSAAAGSVLVLDPEDKVSARRGGWLTACGLVFFVSLFELLNLAAMRSAYGVRFRRTYRVGHADVMDINNKVVSAVQAVLSCVTGGVVCSYSCGRDFLHTSHYISEAYAWFGAAYFFYDIWSMYKVYVQMSLEKDAKPRPLGARNGVSTSTRAPPTFLEYCRYEPMILMHHVFIGGFGFLFIVYLRGGLGDCVFGYIYLMELSTPFVSIRGILSRLGLKQSNVYVANGLLMMAVFAVCRLMGVPYALMLYASNVGMGYFEAWQSLPTGCKVSITILMIPQFYWFYLMTAGAMKVFLSSAPTSPSSPLSPPSPLTPQTPEADEKVDKRS